MLNTGNLYHRQLGVINPDVLLKQIVVLIGCGGIGSPTATFLAKMGIGNFILYDDDKVEEHNLPNQMYGHNFIGFEKVRALKHAINWYGGDHIKVDPIEDKFSGQKVPAGSIVILATDSIESRAEIWKNCLKMNASVNLLVDARMGLYASKIFSIEPFKSHHCQRYEETLHVGVSEEAPCTQKAIIFNTAGIASFVCSLILAHIKNQSTGKEEITNYFAFDFRNLTVFANERWDDEFKI